MSCIAEAISRCLRWLRRRRSRRRVDNIGYAALGRRRARDLHADDADGEPGRLHAWQEKTHQRPNTSHAFYTDRAASFFGEALDLGEPEAGAAARGFCREVRVEGVREDLLGHTLPVVGDNNLDEPPSYARGGFDVPGCDGDYAAVRHSIGRVSA